MTYIFVIFNKKTMSKHKSFLIYNMDCTRLLSPPKIHRMHISSLPPSSPVSSSSSPPSVPSSPLPTLGKRKDRHDDLIQEYEAKLRRISEITENLNQEFATFLPLRKKIVEEKFIFESKNKLLAEYESARKVILHDVGESIMNSFIKQRSTLLSQKEIFLREKESFQLKMKLDKECMDEAFKKEKEALIKEKEAFVKEKEAFLKLKSASEVNKFSDQKYA